MGYMRTGKILNIDLTKGKVCRESSEPYRDRFLGGHGINLKILYDRVHAGVKPFDPENVLIFGTGPFTGTMVPGSGRTAVAAKSPQTGLMGRSNFGGHWGPELKFAGYDHLVISGQAALPVYIAIDNDRVEIRDAAHLWGIDTIACPKVIRNELGDPDTKVVSIGPAGENRVVFATVISEMGHGGGKTGMGAVMGAKNLKAVAVRGTKGVKIANPQAFMDMCLQSGRKLRECPKYAKFSTIGTLSDELDNKDGSIVLGNYQATHWDKHLLARFTAFWDRYKCKRTGCYNCPVSCMEHYDVPDLGPSLTSCIMYSNLTWGLQVADPMLWYELNCICQQNGIDPTSSAGLIHWAMELFHDGLIDETVTDGVPMIAGSRHATVGMLRKIVNREGFGDILARGVEAAVAEIGPHTTDYMIQVKNIPLSQGNRFNFRGSALATATGNRGDWVAGRDWAPDTLSKLTSGLPEVETRLALDTSKKALSRYGLEESDLSFRSYEGKASLMALISQLTSVTDMLLNCKYHTSWLLGAVGIELQAKLLSAGEGRTHGVETLLDAGKRIHCLERAFNIREGLTRDDDTLPTRFFEKPIPGFFPDDTLDRTKFEQMKDEYYGAMGWDPKTGIPTRQNLMSLDLPEVIGEFETLEKPLGGNGAARSADNVASQGNLTNA